MVAAVTGVADGSIGVVGRDACEACCRSLRPAEDLNPVIASLVYEGAGTILRAGGMPGCSAEKAESLRRRVVNHLGVIHGGPGDRAFPPEVCPAAAPTPSSAPRVQGERHRWLAGVITAPRDVSTLGATLQSLEDAGFGSLHIFAEPGSAIPPEAHRHHLHVNRRRLGNFANFYGALAFLFEHDRDADCMALFQDDIRAAAGLKAWCDAQLWPEGSGIVSLFTPRVHADDRAGWRLRSPGYFRVFGGQALVFRRDVLAAFLSDPRVVAYVHATGHWDDAIVSSWAARQGLGIAYHTPSLVQHVGIVSTLRRGGPDPRVVADAVSRVDAIGRWRAPERRYGKVGLVGWSSLSGLGYQNLDIARHLELDRWIVPIHPRAHCEPDRAPACPVRRIEPDADRRTIRACLDGLDWLLFVEQPTVPGLAQVARGLGVRVALVPNWEWLRPDLDWLSYVDLMICPTRHTFLHIDDWCRRYGFGWDVRLVPWPVDAHRLRFVPRRRCDRFVFVNGWGGGRGRRLDGSPAPYRRKGFELIVEAAQSAPHLRFLVYSQRDDMPALPANIELRPAQRDNRELYAEGDVCVQPSRFEGLGLQMLECQAAGMPLVTTDAPPMNEYQPLATVPVAGTEVLWYGGDQPIPVHRPSAVGLVDVLERLVGTDITEASRRARSFIESTHSWDIAAPLLRECLPGP